MRAAIVCSRTPTPSTPPRTRSPGIEAADARGRAGEDEVAGLAARTRWRAPRGSRARPRSCRRCRLPGAARHSPRARCGRARDGRCRRPARSASRARNGRSPWPCPRACLLSSCAAARRGASGRCRRRSRRSRRSAPSATTSSISWCRSDGARRKRHGAAARDDGIGGLREEERRRAAGRDAPISRACSG